MATRFPAPPLSGRRTPRQQRSRATVNALVEAAAHVLAARGGKIPLVTQVSQVIDGIIAIHSANQRLHRVLLDEVPLTARANGDAFEVEYLRRYQALILSGAQRPADPRDAIAAEVLAAAVEGAIHTAASRGKLRAPEVRLELNGFVCAYLRERFVPS